MPTPVSETASIDVAPRRHGRMGRGVVFVEIDVGGLERQAAALRHGVARVHGEVQDDLLDLARIGLHRAEITGTRG